MDVEELNKTQIILLTLLISFITSIATGIVTVSLMNQAPQVVTDTVHKVIEKTVEKVVPGEQQATIIENTKTIVVSDQDFIISAVEKNSPVVVRLFTTAVGVGEDLQTTTDEFVGLGIVVSDDGRIIANQSLVSPPADYFFYQGGEKITLTYLKDLIAGEIGLWQATRADAGDEEETAQEQLTFSPVELGDSDNLKLGQSVVSLGGQQSDVVLTGIISNLKKTELPTIMATSTDEVITPAQTTVSRIETNLNATLPMNLLIDLDGKLIGVKAKDDFYLPINPIKQALEELPQEENSVSS